MNKSFHMMSFYTAILAGVAALAYAIFFVALKNTMPIFTNIFLLALGLFGIEVFVTLYGRLKNVNEDFARVAMVLGVIGAAGTAIHAGYDLANTINPPAGMNVALPNPVDPRGLLTFGFMGLALLKTSWLMSKDTYFPKNLSMLGYLSGILLLVIYVGRLTVMNPANPILLYPILVAGFIVNPLWYVWLGAVLKKS